MSPQNGSTKMPQHLLLIERVQNCYIHVGDEGGGGPVVDEQKGEVNNQTFSWKNMFELITINAKSTWAGHRWGGGKGPPPGGGLVVVLRKIQVNTESEITD